MTSPIHTVYDDSLVEKGHVWCFILFLPHPQDTMEFIRNFQSEAPLKRGSVSAQDASLHERVMAQVI